MASVAFGCDGSPGVSSAPSASVEPQPVSPAAATPEFRPLPPVRAQLDGRAFPDKLIALTWDDGPDANTLALASYLHRQHVSATFFVVREWDSGVSSDPGSGKDEFETGYEYLPILGDLVELGHRVGNHTLNHVLLSQTGTDLLDVELRANQESIDPYLTNELRIFRAPGGAWSAQASRATDADPYLQDLVGPIRWDVDRKDWESSLYCRSSRPAAECEPAGPWHESRVKPGVVAARYLASIEAAGHGVVLFHDRVGDVGSSYALEIAERVVPQLRARGYVFVAPILGFVEAQPRLASSLGKAGQPSPTRASLQLGDLDGDGRADACLHASGEHRCARSAEVAGTIEDRRPRTIFEPPSRPDLLASCATSFESESIQLADVDGDGRADVCATLGFGIACAIVGPSGECGPAAKWSLWGKEGSTNDSPARLGDLDGDGRADACKVSDRGIECAKSSGHDFGMERTWFARGGVSDGWPKEDDAGTLALADVDGDGRADACGRTKAGIVCARSTGTSFGLAETWSSGQAFTADARLLFGDLNGDGRADVCALSNGQFQCALSTGRAFTQASVWLAADGSGDAGRIVRAPSLALGDVNGDGRADLCGEDAAGVACALAP